MSDLKSREEAIDFLRFAIEATGTDDDYSIGLRNGIRLAISVFTGEAPKYDRGKCEVDTNRGDIIDSDLSKYIHLTEG